MESSDKVTPYYIQAVLIVFYVVLAVLFGLRRATWPISVYYIGCFIKDAAVFALAMLKLRA